MSEDKRLEALKTAILMERRGETFYRTVAQQTKNDEVKKFFVQMADEEKKHASYLAENAESLTKTGELLKKEYVERAEDLSGSILTDEIRQKVGAASYEAAAISAAIAFEKSAIEVYSARAKETSDVQERALFSWLAEWEATHLDFLDAINADLIEEAWADQRFWPF